MFHLIGRMSPTTRRIAYLGLGIVLGASLHRQIDNLGQEIRDYQCGTMAALHEAARLRQQAVQFELEASRIGNPSLSDSTARPMHQKANALYERTAKCGSPVALAHLGLAHCAGYAFPIDKNKGLDLIREASMSVPSAELRQAFEVCVEPRKAVPGSFRVRSNGGKTSI